MTPLTPEELERLRERAEGDVRQWETYDYDAEVRKRRAEVARERGVDDDDIDWFPSMPVRQSQVKGLCLPAPKVVAILDLLDAERTRADSAEMQARSFAGNANAFRNQRDDLESLLTPLRIDLQIARERAETAERRLAEAVELLRKWIVVDELCECDQALANKSVAFLASLGEET